MLRNRILTATLSLFLGIACYWLYAYVIVPTLVIPPGSIRTKTIRRDIGGGPKRMIDDLSQKNSKLLAELFPDPNDWRRRKPGFLMAEDGLGLFLFDGKPNFIEGGRGLSLSLCTIVIPSQDNEFKTEEERYRHAVVVETSDRLEVFFKHSINVDSLSAISLDFLDEGKLHGEVTVWSRMKDDSLDDDFRLTTRDVSFNSELMTTDSEVFFHYGAHQVDGTGMRVYLDLVSKGLGRMGKVDQDNPLVAAYENGNLFGGISVKEVWLSKLNTLEFSLPDYLPEVPQADQEIRGFFTKKNDRQNGGADTDNIQAPGTQVTGAGSAGGVNGVDGGEKDSKPMVRLEVRSQNEVYFAPNVTDDPAVWSARFAGNVEVTAYHQEREPDSLLCDSLYLYLVDWGLKRLWDIHGKDFKSKRKPSGKLDVLEPCLFRALGTSDRKTVLSVAGGVMRAEGGEIVCDVWKNRISIQPLPPAAPQPGDPPDIVQEPEPVSLKYQTASVLSDKIEFIYDEKTYGSLVAYKKGTLRNSVKDKEGNDRSVTVQWKEGVKIVPTDEDPSLHVASFRGDVLFKCNGLGEIRADETDFWFQVKSREKNPDGSETVGVGYPPEPFSAERNGEPWNMREKNGDVPAVIPQSAQFRRNIVMKFPQGESRIRDDVNIRFAQESPMVPFGGSPESVASGENGEGGKESLFGSGRSLMGGEGKSRFVMDGGNLNVWAVVHEDGGMDVSQIAVQNKISLLETSLDHPGEELRIEGNDVRVDNPASDGVSVVLRGQPANFTGHGLNLSGYDIRVSRAENTFSVIGNGRLRIAPQAFVKQNTPNGAGGGANQGNGMVAGNASAGVPAAMRQEPVEVWWPNGMTFDGKALVFQGEAGRRGGGQEMVTVRQGNSIELRSPLISLILKNRIEIFDFDMETTGDGMPKDIELEKSVCQGTPDVPVSVFWFGSFVSQKPGQSPTQVKGRCQGEVAYLTLAGAGGEFNATGPGWLNGTFETPKEFLEKNGRQGGSGGVTGLLGGGSGATGQNGIGVSERKPWSHMHLVFSDSVSGNIEAQSMKVLGDVRTVFGTSDRSDAVLNVNDHSTFTPDAFFLTCQELGLAKALSPGGGNRTFEMTAYGGTRFEYQAFTGMGDILKYNDAKKAVALQGNGVTPARLSRQERPGMPVNTQTFNSVVFYLDTNKMETNISNTEFSGGR